MRIWVKRTKNGGNEKTPTIMVVKNQEKKRERKQSEEKRVQNEEKHDAINSFARF